MFLSEDVQKAKAFGDFISRCAEWKLSTADALNLNRHFAWYNTVVQKIEEHVLELQKTFEKPKEDTSIKKGK